MSFRRFAKAAIEKTAAYRLLGSSLSGLATIFVLHRVIRDDESVLDSAVAVNERFLNAAVSHVINRGYEIVSLEGLCSRLNARSHRRHMVVFTFDDGYRDNGLIASKVFERHRVPWSLYLTTGFPDRTCSYWWGALEEVLRVRDVFEIEMRGFHRKFEVRSIAEKRAAFELINRIGLDSGPELASYLADRYNVKGSALLAEKALSWSELRELVSGGLMELGGHTVTHPLLTRLSDAEARREIAACRSRIREMTGVDTHHFAYPHGAKADRHDSLVLAAGFKTATTTVPCNVFLSAYTGLQVMPRIRLDGRYQRLSQVELHLSGLTALSALGVRHPFFRRLRT
jgi:peptidoglycan/xylan/chitin deacetylase (PgdA/CDA1 family)